VHLKASKASLICRTKPN